MIAEAFSALCHSSPSIRKALWKRWYEFLGGYYQKTDWKFMNYGYASLDASAAILPLLPEDEPNRYSIQLYHNLVTHFDSGPSLDTLDVLEVGSGRGGGCVYMKKYLNPKTVVGLDYSIKTVAFCNRHFQMPGLMFIPGDAESQPFADNRFDVIVNVESSHCYRSMESFVEQAKRVLKSEGHFICADLRHGDEVDKFQHLMRHSGMTVIKEVDITAHVIEALKLDHDRKLTQIRASALRLLMKPFKEYAGLKGSKIYNQFRTGEAKYFAFILKKP
jgi:SAM-dependent methyltransferase